MTKLDKIQKHVLSLFKMGYNLFITGPGGRGKSFLIQQMLNINDNVVVCSTTGLSSINVNGQTLHSWSGLTPDTDLNDIEEFVSKIKNNNRLGNKWRFTKILVIDEVSMLTGEILDFLHRVAQNIRGNTLPFGGIQIILTGDFLQLPPVTENKSPFAFQSECWNSLIDYTIILKKCYRQNNCQLVNFLDDIRIANITPNIIKMLNTFHNNSNYSENYTHLYPTRAGVQSHNLRELQRLNTKQINIKANIQYKSNKINNFKFPTESSIVETLILKVGAFLIINKNIDVKKGLVNGRQGILTEINDTKLVIKIDQEHFTLKKECWEFNNYNITQFPVRLAWALTIHKSQGMSIDRLSIDIGNSVFSNHQAYVALSRATNMDTLHIKDFNISLITVHPDVKQYYDDLSIQSQNWYKCNDNEKVYYENKVSGITSWKIPDGNIIDPPMNIIDDKLITTNNINNHICQYCKVEIADNEYYDFFDELICGVCLPDYPEYKLLNKTDLYTEFRNKISKKKLEDIFKQDLLYKSQRVKFGNRYGKSCRLYLIKHIDEEIKITSNEVIQNTSNILTQPTIKIQCETTNIIRDKLKTLRTKLAKEKNIPPYCIFTNKTLEELLNSRIQTLEDLIKVNGMGKTRLDKYGNDILEVLT